jgi:hypothetical protein
MSSHYLVMARFLLSPLDKKIHKDNLLNEWCEVNEYSMIRIKEDRFILNREECFSILGKIIDERVKGLTLIY